MWELIKLHSWENTEPLSRGFFHHNWDLHRSDVENINSRVGGKKVKHEKYIRYIIFTQMGNILILGAVY